MSYTQPARLNPPEFDPIYIRPARFIGDISEDVRAGLLTPPRSLPPKYFYDDHGSSLFEQITRTPEYYPTRVEDQLLVMHAREIIRLTMPQQILELGSGSSRKTQRLFDACDVESHQCCYAPLDVCEAAINQAVNHLHQTYGWLEVIPLIGDYHAGLEHIPDYEGRRLFIFLGSSIGNFTPAQSQSFINELKDCMHPGDSFLLGADRVKPCDILNAAYNDNQGFTAAFNLNVLRVLNREINADFAIDNFSHIAIFNKDLNRIEMSVQSDKEQIVNLRSINETLRLDAGERILTELSYKFQHQQLEELHANSGLEIVRHFQPENGYFSLVLSRLPG